MLPTFTIQLHNLRFMAPHGVFEEEAAVGNEFELNISLTVNAPAQRLVSLDETINYAQVFQLVKKQFSTRKALLETLAMEVAAELKSEFPAIRALSIQIHKLHPPITAFTGSVSVTYHKQFEN